MSETLYRFYGKSDDLLYIGVTANIPDRVRSHAREKDWWAEVSRITLQPYPDRAAVVAAEEAAIKAESPRYNVIHNGQQMVERVSRRAGQEIVDVGDWVALGLRSGDCPVGEVLGFSDSWVKIELIDWLVCMPGGQVRVIWWDDVEQMTISPVAYSWADEGGGRRINDEPLCVFQTAWLDVYGKKDQLAEAKRRARLELYR